LDGVFTLAQVKNLGQYDRGHLGQGLQAHVASRVGRGGEYDVQPDHAGLVVGEEVFEQLGQAFARPGPGAFGFDAVFVDVDDDDALFGCGIGGVAPDLVFEGVLNGDQQGH
jgi:hypothetical protein